MKFYKETDLWYADIPEYIQSGGTKDDCMMVSGADTWLEFISNGKSEIELKIGVEHFEEAEVLNIHQTDEGFPEYGAYYRVGTYKGEDLSNHIMWLCPVTLFVFGKYPKQIFYKLEV